MSKLRRRMMMQQQISASGYTLIFDCVYNSISDRNVSVYWQDKLVYNFNQPSINNDTFDFGAFVYSRINNQPANYFQFSPSDAYFYRGHSYQSGDYFQYGLGDVRTDDVVFINVQQPQALRINFRFDYNGGGNNRRMCWGLDGFNLGQWVGIGNWGYYLPVDYMPFEIQRIGAAVDYFGLKANTPFECEGVVYNTGETLYVPWLNPLSTIIDKQIRIL